MQVTDPFKGWINTRMDEWMDPWWISAEDSNQEHGTLSGYTYLNVQYITERMGS